MIKHFTRILSFTWLIWLYSGTSLVSVPNVGTVPGDGITPALRSAQVASMVIASSTRSTRGFMQPAVEVDPYEPRLEVHLSNRKLTLYRGNTAIRQYPIAIGQRGWETPTGRFRVLDMREKPIWIHPFTHQVVPNSDPKNPLGRFWIGFWTDGEHWVGFHGTPHEKMIGQAVSHGCIRMHDEHIDEVYYQVSTGTPVIVTP